MAAVGDPVPPRRPRPQPRQRPRPAPAAPGARPQRPPRPSQQRRELAPEPAELRPRSPRPRPQPQPRTGPSRRPGRRRRRRYDPPPRTLGEALQRLWVVGPLAVVLVTILVLVTGPGDLSILRRFFVFFSTAAFGVWLLREHRRRIPVRQRLLIFNVCAGALVVLFLVLTISAF